MYYHLWEGPLGMHNKELLILLVVVRFDPRVGQLDKNASDCISNSFVKRP